REASAATGDAGSRGINRDGHDILDQGLRWALMAGNRDIPVTETALQHTRLQELVAPFADGELTREEKRAVEEHLRSCGRCRCELALQRDLSRAPRCSRRLPARDDA